MRVLVTGGTGYLGRAVVQALTQTGHEPVVFARTATSSGLAKHLADGDVRDMAALERAATGCDAICHLAALVSVWRSRAADFDDVNVGGLHNVLDLVRRLRIPRLLYTSSFLALPPADRTTSLSVNDYQRTKVIAEGIAERAANEGLPVIRLYPGVVYGPGPATEGNLVAKLIRDHLAGRLPGLIGADRPWSYAWIDDVAQAHVAALSAAQLGSRYVLGGDNVPQMRVFEVVRDLTGCPLPRRIPFALATAIAVVEESRAALFSRPPLLTRGIVEIFRHDWSLNSDAAIRDLGYRVGP